MYRAFLPADRVPANTPFDKSPMRWRLYRLLPNWVADDPALTVLKDYLAGPDPDTRRYQLASQIADLFDQYQMFRGDWLAYWASGNDRLIDLAGRSSDIPSACQWQPIIWRYLNDQFEPETTTSRDHIHRLFIDYVGRGGRPARPERLPARIVVFGLSSLSQSTLEVLHALSRHTQVVFCVHNPSRWHWADIFSDRDLFRARGHKRGRLHPVFSTDLPAHERQESANPLLASWGKQGRDTMRLLDRFDDPNTYDGLLPTPDGQADLFRPFGPPDSPRLLHLIQNDVLELRPVQEIQSLDRKLEPDDDSLVFNLAHSPQREVEILHDHLLDQFNRDPSLNPTDVVVMVPDINQYAPHIRAAFERYAHFDKRYLPFSITDQGRRLTSPLLGAVELLLSLDQARLTASQVLSLLEVPSLAARFDMSDADLP